MRKSLATGSNNVWKADANCVWNPAPRELVLNDGEVHVWRASLDVPAPLLQHFLATLSADEQSRHGRFHFQKDRNHFAAGRGLLRLILGRYLKLEPAQLRFDYGAQGKPSIQTGADRHSDALRFNLSHSGGIALLALARGRDVGVDVELVRTDIATGELAERFFSRHEIAALRALPSAMRHTAFFKCWTRKEAFIKAVGGGLSIPLDQFDVALAPNLPPALLRTEWNPNEASRWSMYDLNADTGYAAALVVEGKPSQLNCWHFSQHLSPSNFQ